MSLVLINFQSNNSIGWFFLQFISFMIDNSCKDRWRIQTRASFFILRLKMTSSSAITTNNTNSKDEDVAFWLHNKLGSHADLWSSFSISSTLTQEHLLSIKSILWTLDTLVKVKLLLSFIHIPKRNITEVRKLIRFSMPSFFFF